MHLLSSPLRVALERAPVPTHGTSDQQTGSPGRPSRSASFQKHLVGLVASTLFLLTGCDQLQTDTETPSTAPEDLFLYTNCDKPTTELLIKEFEAEYSRVNVEFGSGPVLAGKVLNGADESVDVVWVDSLWHLKSIFHAKLTQPINGELVQTVRAASRAPQRYWIPIYHRTLCLAVNRRLADRHEKDRVENEPKLGETWKSLSSPVKGWLDSSRQVSGWVDNSPMLRIFEERMAEEAKSELANLPPDKRKYPSFQKLLMAIHRGEVRWGLVPLDIINQGKKNDLHVRALPLPSLGYIVDASSIVILKKRPHASSCNPWIKYLLSKSVQQFVTSEFGFQPVVEKTIRFPSSIDQSMWDSSLEATHTLITQPESKPIGEATVQKPKE